MAKFTTLKFSPQNFFYILGGFILIFWGLYLGRGFLIPFCFSLLMAFILVPMIRFFERKGMGTVLSICVAFLIVILLFFGVSYFFSSQIAGIISDFENFKSELSPLLDRVINMYNENLPFLPPIDAEGVILKVQSFLQNSGGNILGSTLLQTTSFLANFALIPVYVFLLLLYRRGLVKGFLMFFDKNQRDDVRTIIYEMQSVGKDYIVGLMTVMLIMAVLNSTFMLIIGIDYAIMFGCLAALLIVIPYIGTYVGGALPVLYALVTLGSTSALAILICFIVVQMIEGNYLTPKIVGSNTSVNALAAFITLVIGGSLWGIAGMVLSIPFTAMLNKIFAHVKGLQPLSLILGEELFQNEDLELKDLEIEYINEENPKPVSLLTKLKNFFTRKTLNNGDKS
ncbi:AI-2E family transporter [Ornithobacterium rhinotracheale]|uniref:AI-2E family transporter n=1 Tax=Ornithobacterium rhinotracheale TaxID=28251 RepID=A0A410JTK9_ORNRH|nr:AI-2E family transporter [Ornithobacterium rhinotracheale]QAR31547.1 AI-2E family transporter [Ornithobacterium rhinotracheale]